MIKTIDGDDYFFSEWAAYTTPFERHRAAEQLSLFREKLIERAGSEFEEIDWSCTEETLPTNPCKGFVTITIQMRKKCLAGR